MILGQLAALDLRQQSDRADRMFVDRIMVIHVELHLRDDLAEVGHEAAEHPGLIHPAKHQVRRRLIGQRFEEQGIGDRVVTHPVDQPSVALSGAHRRRVNLEPFTRGEREQLDQPRWPFGKESLVGDRQPPAHQREAIQLRRSPAEGGEQEPPPLDRQLLIDLGKEDSGQIADRLGLEEIELHEPLDRRFARPVGVAHRPRDPRLIVEPEPFLGAPGGEVEVAADRPQETLGALEPAKLLGAEQPRFDHPVAAFDPEQMIGDPV